MTEREWLASTEPTTMLEFLRGTVSDRKLRFFARGCCRRVWHLLTDERSRKAVEIVEKYVDGLASDDEANNAMMEADQAWRDLERDHADRHEYADRAASCGRWAAYYTDFPERGAREALLAALWEKAEQGTDHLVAEADEQEEQCAMLRDIFGNPFRTVAVDPAWLTPSVVELARSIYDDRAFDRLPVLADALDEASCTDASLLEHLRSPGPHVRGCFAVDLLLRKE